MNLLKTNLKRSTALIAGGLFLFVTIILLAYKLGEWKAYPKYNEHLKTLSYTEKIQHLQTTYKYYQRAPKEELLVQWVKIFSKSTYLLNGDGKYNQYDCVSSCYAFLNVMGANVTVNNVVYTYKRLQQMHALGYAKLRTNFYDIQPGDILISHDASHMSIVYDKKENFVIYMDVNFKLKGMGINQIHWTDKNITAIYSMSFHFWSGNLSL